MHKDLARNVLNPNVGVLTVSLKLRGTSKNIKQKRVVRFTIHLIQVLNIEKIRVIYSFLRLLSASRHRLPK